MRGWLDLQSPDVSQNVVSTWAPFILMQIKHHSIKCRPVISLSEDELISVNRQHEFGDLTSKKTATFPRALTRLESCLSCSTLKPRFFDITKWLEYQIEELVIG